MRPPDRLFQFQAAEYPYKVTLHHAQAIKSGKPPMGANPHAPHLISTSKHHLRHPSDIGKLFLFAGEEEEIALLCGNFLILYGFISGGGMAAAAYQQRRLISGGGMAAAYPKREEKRASKSETLVHCFT